MTALVTGGAGYIGSHVVRHLRDRGDSVVVLDSLASGHRAAVPPDVPLVVGDVRDQTLVARVLADHDVTSVVHLAAEKSVAKAMATPGATFDANVTGTLALLEAMASTGVRHLVFSSTCAVYGTPVWLPVDETARLAPDNPYGESKAMAERLVEWFGRLRGLRAVVLRYFNAAGADPGGDLGEDWHDAENLVPVVLRAAWTGEPVHVFGTDYSTPDGTAIRDYVHVADLAEAHALALEHLSSGGDGETLNLGTGTGTSVLEVVATARAVTDRPIEVVDDPRRAGDPAAVWADASRAEAVLGWRARHGIEAMLRSAWAWHRRHPDGLGERAEAGAVAGGVVG